MSKIAYVQMSSRGDDRFEFDTATPVGLTEAEAKFREITGLGHVAIDTKGQKMYRSFDPTIEETVFRPPLAGG